MSETMHEGFVCMVALSYEWVSEQASERRQVLQVSKRLSKRASDLLFPNTSFRWYSIVPSFHDERRIPAEPRQHLNLILESGTFPAVKSCTHCPSSASWRDYSRSQLKTSTLFIIKGTRWGLVWRLLERREDRGGNSETHYGAYDINEGKRMEP